ncbi:MAG TPA: c-type cytochrome domain-containing protein, partial [Bryobacteraceae bacterium]|nr:c-type cytochrome domain-containing protein [Bryobacteraceae bacterium]
MTAGFALLAAPLFGFAQQIEFNREIRPILSDRCFMCHGPDASHRQAGLRFDLPTGDLTRPEIQRELLRRVAETGNHRMPPASSGKAPLTEREIRLLRDWVAQGAKTQGFWSFIPPVRPASGNSIDAFIQARLAKEG